MRIVRLLLCGSLCWSLGCNAYISNNYLNHPPLIDLPVPMRLGVPPKKLTLHDAILLSLRTNPNVQTAEIQRVADKFALEVAHNAFEPQYTFNASATYQPGSKPQYTVTPAVTLLTPLGTQLGATYSGNYLGGGGSGSSITLSAVQPLLRGFGPKVTMAPLVIAEYTEATAHLTLKNTVMETITTVIQDYYALVQAYNNLTTDELALENSLAMLHELQIRVKAGQAAPLELAPQESQVANQRLRITQDKDAIQQAYQTLLTTLGLDPNSKLDIDKNIYLDATPLPAYELSSGLALENNITYLQTLYQLKQDELNVITSRDAQRWQLNLTATKTIQPGSGSGSTPTAVIGGTTTGGTTLNGTTTGGITTGGTTVSGDESVTLSLNIPINDKSLQQQLVDAEVALAQEKINVAETRRQVRSDVLTALQTLDYQWQQVLQAEDAVKYAQQAFDTEVIKLRYGRSTVLNVTQLRAELTNAKLSLIAQQIAYINTYAEFEQTLGLTLEKWGIQIFY